MRRLMTLLVVLGVVGCSNNPFPLADVFPGTNSISGWTTSQPVQIYNHDTIFRLVDGQADFFFTYGFQQVAAQRYQSTNGGTVDVEVWQLTSPADAYGLFTAVASAAPTNIGNDGDLETGRRLSFWQDRYTVHVSARQQVEDVLLFNFGKAIAQRLPTGGERPALVGRLPQVGLKNRGYVFFHEELAIQDRVFLGGKNLLGLSHDSDGVVAQYDLAGLPVRLMLIRYPSADKAMAGLQALQSSTIKDLASCRTYGNLLGAVFGKGDKTQIDQWLADAMRSQ